MNQERGTLSYMTLVDDGDNDDQQQQEESSVIYREESPRRYDTRVFALEEEGSSGDEEGAREASHAASDESYGGELRRVKKRKVSSAQREGADISNGNAASGSTSNPPSRKNDAQRSEDGPPGCTHLSLFDENKKAKADHHVAYRTPEGILCHDGAMLQDVLRLTISPISDTSYKEGMPSAIEWLKKSSKNPRNAIPPSIDALHAILLHRAKKVTRTEKPPPRHSKLIAVRPNCNAKTAYVPLLYS